MAATNDLMFEKLDDAYGPDLHLADLFAAFKEDSPTWALGGDAAHAFYAAAIEDLEEDPINDNVADLANQYWDLADLTP